MDPLLGQIQLFAFNYAPMGWMRCEGQILQVNANSALFSLLGAQFGGDGRTTFALPNLMGAEPNPNSCYYIATQGLYPTRD